MTTKPEHAAGRYRGRTRAEWAAIESAEHDSHYRGSYPFGGDGFTFTVEQALAYEDYCYKQGRARWGHRTRKFLELLDVEALPGKTVLDVGAGRANWPSSRDAAGTSAQLRERSADHEDMTTPRGSSSRSWSAVARAYPFLVSSASE